MSLAESAEETLFERREKALGAGAPLFYDKPLHLIRGEGAHLFDVHGRRYVDLYNNVTCVGHANPHVVEAMARQQATLNVHSRYLHEGIVEFAERLVGLHTAPIESVIFSCSGTEANEVALRMARFATGKGGFVCSNYTYHGNSDLVGRLTFVEERESESREVRAFPFPETYRAIEEASSDVELGEIYLGRVQRAIEGLETGGAGFAALIVCSIFANEGLPNVPPGFMAKAAEMARRAGGLVIADEVQGGYARTGRWWGYEAAGFLPDIVVTGKPMGNGLPLAATAASRALINDFRAKTRYFNTFAASPLQAAVGMAVLDVIEGEDLRQRSAEVGAFLKRALTERKARWSAIGDVRGRGLFVGVEMVKDRTTKEPDINMATVVCDRLKDKGFLTAPAGAYGNVVKIRPPLVFTHSDAVAFIDAFDAVVEELDG
ncbi:MAG: aspartate aminotransferase family protein [Caulobacteraceae bacterium]|nr:aspartate aminotransferase family protein [Caulobacteraceae bacterium]